jgi:lysophospholipase L1-like esterase
MSSSSGSTFNGRVTDDLLARAKTQSREEIRAKNWPLRLGVFAQPPHFNRLPSPTIVMKQSALSTTHPLPSTPARSIFTWFPLALVAIALSLFPARAADAPPAHKPRVALAGDSTVTTTAGWGAAFEELLGPRGECIQLARGGQSSKSFRDSGQWAKVIEAKPDYVLIQFGHNDMPGKGPNRETDPATTYRENLARFVDEARAAGAVPILVTSMARRTFENGKIRGELAPWAEAARQVAAEKKVPLVDLFARSVALLEKMGPEASAVFDPKGKDGKPDHTHLSPDGAKIIAKLIAEELRKSEPPLGKLLTE